MYLKEISVFVKAYAQIFGQLYSFLTFDCSALTYYQVGWSLDHIPQVLSAVVQVFIAFEVICQNGYQAGDVGFNKLVAGIEVDHLYGT